MRFVILLFMLAAGCILAAPPMPLQADEPKPDDLTAQQVLDRMAKTYSVCKSYRDTGVVNTVFHKSGNKQTVQKPFKTAFVRPDRLRFEYTDQDKTKVYRHIVWQQGEQVRVWWDVTPGIEEVESLGLALAGATGVSGGSAHTVPALLMTQEVGGRTLMEMTETKRIDDAKVGEVECMRIEGKFADSPMTLWLDKQTFLVRRIDLTMKLTGFRTETTTTYEPVINEEIADKLLKFDPPKAK